MLFLYEIKKLYKNKLFFFLLVLFIAFDFFCIFTTCKPYLDETYKTETELTDRFEGKLTKEKVDEITYNYNRLEELVNNNAYSAEYSESSYTGYEYMDYNVFSKLNDELSRIYNFADKTDEIIEKINSYADFLSDNENDYLAGKYRKTADSISSREITEIHNYTAVNEYIDYDTSSLFIILLSAFTSVITFSKDREIVDILYTCTYGKAKIFSAKLMMIIFSSAVITFLFRLFDLIVFKSFIGLRGFTSPLFYLEKFEMTYFSGSVMSFSVLETVGVFLSVLIASMICVCVSVITYKADFSLLLSVTAALIIFSKGFSADDFNYPKYAFFLPIGYARLLLYLFISAVLVILAKILHKGSLKNGNIKA
ncbi:MAG: hypothetical protein LIO62_03510 [Clostridiales bacterium]|nr:hypothetical protein [Clostridiales bacterium]